MTVAVSDVKTKFSEWSATADATVLAALNEAERQTARSFFGNVADDYILYLTAHILKDNARLAAGGASPRGAIASEALDGWSASYAVPTNQTEFTAWLTSTAYGRKAAAYRAQGLRVISLRSYP